MRLTNHNLNRNTEAAVAIRKALKEEKNLSGSAESRRASEAATEIRSATTCQQVASESSAPPAQLPPCDLNYAFKDIARRFLK